MRGFGDMRGVQAAPNVAISQCHLVYTNVDGHLISKAFDSMAERGRFYDTNLQGVECMFVDGDILHINEEG